MFLPQAILLELSCRGPGSAGAAAKLGDGEVLSNSWLPMVSFLNGTTSHVCQIRTLRAIATYYSSSPSFKFSPVARNRASLVAQTVKNLPAMKETEDQSPGWEDPLWRGMATTPITLPGEFHGQRSLVGYSPSGLKESDMSERVTLSLCEAYGILIPQPGIELEPSAVKVWSLNHRITREFLILIIFKKESSSQEIVYSQNE